MAHPESLRQCLEQADNILADVCASLGRERASAESGVLFSRDLGASRAAANIHPGESLRAAAILHDVIFEVVEDETRDDPALGLRAARALHHSLMFRIREASIGYASLLLNEIHEAHLAERRRIALELHDRVGCGISVASRNLELYEMLRERDPVRADAKAEQAQSALRDTLENVRRLTADMRVQAQLEGLEKSLQSYLDVMSPGDVAVRLVVNGDEGWAPAEVLEQLFLVVREALRNVFAHAEARTVAVRVDVAPHMACAAVEDDGTGIPADCPQSAGLASMRERVHLLGGTLSISSVSGIGTSVEISVPLSGARDAAGD
ncbi:histidine kinase [Actinoplanes sp. NPDC049548]|uniref:sensor histidine kinase n=1 Tax=Actinoplanes sp. NPDC049548 TaxID=3155152 RepID=UPI003423986A